MYYMKNVSFITLKIVSRVLCFSKMLSEQACLVLGRSEYVTHRNKRGRKFGRSGKKTERVDLEMYAPFVLTSIPLAFKNLTKALVFFLFCVYCF